MIAVALLLCLGAAPPAMVKLPGGEVQPFFKLRPAPGAKAQARPPVAPPVKVQPFWLDVRPVSQGEYLAFVKAQPRWRRSEVPRLFADAQYLSKWKGDLELFAPEWEAAPVTQVSWFAAKAYCAARGARLPTLAEWELALLDEGREKEAVTRRILEWYQAKRDERPHPAGEGAKNGYGVQDLVGLVWEWTLDFDASPVASDARSPEGGTGLFCGSGGAEAADPSDQASFLRYAFRSSLKASYTTHDLGFRCAKDDR